MSIFHCQNIVLGITGGIAAYKTPYLARLLKSLGADVRIILTPSAKQFVTPTTLQAVSGHPIHDDLFDPLQESAMGHITLARWADYVIIAPATADCIARLAQGHANDLLTTVCLASQAPIFLAPAMNRVMWEKPQTQSNIDLLKQNGLHVLPVGTGEQACGESGEGRMIDPETIIKHLEAFISIGPFKHQKILITAGPTHERIDPVRYLSNPSSGKMGYALAIAAAHMGAEVTLVSGPTHLPPPKGVRTLCVTTALEMHQTVMDHIKDQQIFIAAAAVGDYRIEVPALQKIKKTEGTFSLSFVPNPDILKDVASLPSRPFCVGFAAETENIIENATLKLKQKNLDMICVNEVSDPRIGFNSDNNALTVITSAGKHELPEQPKSSLANELMVTILKSRHWA